MMSELRVQYTDEGIALSWPTADGHRRGLLLPIDDAAALPKGLRDAVNTRQDQTRRSWAVAAHDIGVALLVAAAIGAPLVAIELADQTALALALAVEQAVEKRDEMIVALSALDTLPEIDEPPLP